jgi:hypothetical protein
VEAKKNARWAVDFILCYARPTRRCHIAHVSVFHFRLLKLVLNFYLRWYDTEPYYILHVIDSFTKFTWAKVFTTKHAAPVRQYIEELIAEYGKPRALQFDNGTEFFDLVHLCHDREIQCCRALPYNPQANGQVCHFFFNCFYPYGECYYSLSKL